MTETPSIRSATVDDIPKLARLRWQLYTEREQHDETFEVYVERLRRSHATHLPATTGARGARPQTTGWSLRCGSTRFRACRRRATAIRDRSDYLTNMYVEPDQRSRGLGSRMLREAHQVTARATVFELVLAFPAEDAYRFYERNGFTRPPDQVVHRLGR